MGSLTPLIDLLRQAFALLLVLPVLIAVHELGHFWVARAFGMNVDSFAVMIGGVRKTGLEEHLVKPLVPKSRVWVFAVASHAVLIAGAVQQSVAFTVLGLVLAGIMLPVWIVSRLGTLYHMPSATSFGILVKTWAVAILLSFVGTKFHGLNGLQLLGLTAIFSLVGTAIVYYQPVLHKAEDSPMGEGFVEAQQTLKGNDPLKDRAVVEKHEVDFARGTIKVPVHFRPVVSKRDRKGTEFALLCWPLGGFAAIRGMHPKEDGSETKVDGGFYNKSPFARLLVLFAGPFFSMAFGIGVLTCVLVFSGALVAKPDPVIGTVKDGGPAAIGGLLQGDRVLAVNGKPVTVFFDIVKEVRTSFRKEGDKYYPLPVQLTVDRGSRHLNLTISPLVDSAPSPVLNAKMDSAEGTAIQAKLQIGPTIVRERKDLASAFGEAAMKPIELVAGLVGTIAKPAEIANNVGGPAAIAQAVGQAAKSGVEDVLTIAALLSISLGVMNLLPIGPLDGGQMLVAFAELLRGGRRLSYAIQMRLNTVGALLVIVLVLSVVTLDIGKNAVR